MGSNPGGDKQIDATDSTDESQWMTVLAHRRRGPSAALDAAVERFRTAGVTPDVVESHLGDAGDRLYAAAASGRDGWSEVFGGDHAVALLAAEISVFSSHLVARAASVRAVCVTALLDEYNAVTVASSLGVARQKVYELARGNVDPDFVRTTQWGSK